MSTTCARLDFIPFIEERQAIWWKRQVHPKSPPWTADERLQTAKINNIYRELDAFSRWEIENYSPAQVLVGRVVMRQDLTNLLLSGCGASELADYKPEVCPVSYPQSWLANLPDRLCRWRDLARVWLVNWRDLQGWVDKLPVDEFRKYEILTSLTYSPHAIINEWDIWHLGHGAAPVVREAKLDLRDPIKETLRVRDELFARGKFVPPPDEFLPRPEPFKFTPRQLEDALCEWRKYLDHRSRPWIPRISQN